MSGKSVHDEWLSLIEVSGPFLAVPVLNEAFPQGLEALDGAKKRRIRQAYEEWIEAFENEDPQLSALHTAWIDEVLSKGLELDEHGKGDNLKRKDWCTDHLHFSLVEHSVTLAPDFAVVDSQSGNKPLMLIHAYPQNTDLDKSIQSGGWASSPADRMVHLCRGLACRLGLVTNGERWMLVDAPVGATTTFASWYARIWNQEPVTLQALFHLIGIRRFFVDESEQLPALFDRSLKFQDEVTDALGEQVRRAVEVLIQTLDKADQDRNRELLHDVKEPELYESALTVMMRLVFLLSAEERGLLLMGDERYEANYALSTLRMQLREESEEILERRWDAWSRLLAIFRAVFGGIEHENLRLPALGGSLFDPDRFPFLEGRAKGSNWRTDAATPLPIDNRTVLLLLEAFQQFQGRTLSYRALDVEQIGYVYEGLLERTVKRTDDVTLELDAIKSSKTPWVKFAELDSARLEGAARLAELLQERSGSSASRVRNDLAKPVDDTLADRLLTACQGDTKLRDHVKPYAHLLRTDPWGYPLVYPAGAFIVATGSDRRETGTHYTPKSLTETIVIETLTPVAYVGPAEGTPRDQWVLKSPAELLDLKICDPAMGSGAFLVQACRWLSDRLVEAWSLVEATGKTVSVDGEVLEVVASKEPLPRDSEARTVIARRLIAERCLYGVDLNPLAVELAKLSIWLVTLAKGRPFGFLDHNLRCGDSLLGIHRLDQLTELSMTPGGKGQQRLFGKNIEKAVTEAIELRQRLREMPIRDIHDVKAMARLDADARNHLEVPERISDAFIGVVFAKGTGAALENGLASLSAQGSHAIDGDLDAMKTLANQIASNLTIELPTGMTTLRPFHWPLEFPEVFVSGSKEGFDAVIANPPYSGGKKIGKQLGSEYRQHLLCHIANGRKGSADLCGYFLLRIWEIINGAGSLGVVATSSIAEGDTREVGLDYLIGRGATIFYAHQSFPWPGKASVTVSPICVTKNNWNGLVRLNDAVVKLINPYLYEGGLIEGKPFRLKANGNIAFQGTVVHGTGFVLSESEAAELIKKTPKNAEVIVPYLRGEDFNSTPTQCPSTYVINFRDWPIEKAMEYPDCLSIIQEKVKPGRDKIVAKGGQIHEYDYWKFWDKRLESYDEISSLKHVLFHSFTSKYVAFSFVDVGNVFAAPHVVICFSDFGSFAILQSSIHEVWVRRYTSYSLSLARYTPTDCLETFPFPEKREGAALDGERFFECRKNICVSGGIGLVEIYNKFHDQKEKDPKIIELRSFQAAMDQSTLATYGWSDIVLNHGFFETPRDGVRYTICPDARSELLQRLLELNHTLAAEESRNHQTGDSAKGTTKRGRRPKHVLRQMPDDLFDGEGA